MHDTCIMHVEKSMICGPFRHSARTL